MMLHFLAAVALLIFIGERLWHYWCIMQLRRAALRDFAALYPPAPPSPTEGLASAITVAMIVTIIALAVGGAFCRIAGVI